jgi:hypothetical protein
MSYSYPVGRARRDIRMLACRQWAAWETAQPPRGGCMVDAIAEGTQMLYAPPAESGQDTTSQIPDAGLVWRAGQVRGQWRQIFRGDHELIYVMTGNERDAGTPARACGAAGGSGGHLSCGDRARACPVDLGASFQLGLRRG